MATGVSNDLQAIGRDVATIARDEIALIKEDLAAAGKIAAVDVAVSAFGAIVALIGLGFLCAAAVAALEPLIHPLSLRLLLMAVIYVGIGATLTIVFGGKLRHDVVPRLDRPVAEAKRTIETIKHALEH